MRKLTVVFVLLSLALCGSILASGFAINEQGARAMAQAMAFAARANDASAVFFNPAGITQLEGTHFYTGATLIKQIGSWNDDSQGLSIDTDDKIEIPPHLYMTHQLNERWFLGFGFFVPYGLSKEWPDEFSGKYVNKMATLHNYFINPNVAVKLTDAISVAGGVNIIKCDAKLDRFIYLQDLSNLIFGGYPLDDAYFSAKVDDYKVGWNVGFHAKLSDRAFFGASYRSGVELELEGYLTMTTPQTGVPQIDGTLAALFPSQDAATELPLPGNLFVGIGGSLTDKWETEVDLQWTNWSQYESLPFYFSQQTQALQNADSPKDWENGWAIRWGNEYHMNPMADLRFGMYYDSTPIPDHTLDPFLPGNDRFSFQVGFGLHSDKWVLDFAYMYLYIFDRDITSDLEPGIQPRTGYYKGKAHLFGISLGYRF